MSPKNNTTILYLLCFSLLIEACSSTQTRPTLNKGNSIEAYYPDEYEIAYQYFSQQAQQGSSIAQDNLGQMYSEGRGTPMDLSESLTWYRKAAAQHNADAELNLGLAELYGRGTPENKIMACKFIAQAKQDGNTDGKNFFNQNC